MWWLGSLTENLQKAIDPALVKKMHTGELTMRKKTLLTKMQTYMINNKKKRSHTMKMKLQCSLQVKMKL